MDSPAAVHWQIADVSDPARGSVDPYLHLSREVHVEIVMGMVVDDVFVDGAAQCADYPS